MAVETATPPEGVTTHPAYVKLVYALVGQVQRAAHAEYLTRTLGAERDALVLERDRLRRQVAEMRDTGYRVAEELADALAEVRRLRALAGETAADDGDEFAEVDTTEAEIDAMWADAEPVLLTATRGETHP